jgi:carbon storage regulator
MLVVKRGVGERLVMSGGIEITVVSVGRGGVKLAVSAPREVWVVRGEVHDAAVAANAAAAATAASAFPQASEEDEERAKPEGAP